MIAKKYELLDKAVQNDNEEEVNDLFKDILEETFELINKKIEKEESINIEEEEELFAIRAMFEYMLELWDEGDIEEAKAIGYDMTYLIADEKLKQMFSMLVIGMLAGLSLERFMDKYIDANSVYKDFFFADFNDEIDELVIKYQDKFKKEFAE